MPILDFDKLTPDNQAVKDLKDLIQLTVSFKTRTWSVS